MEAIAPEVIDFDSTAEGGVQSAAKVRVLRGFADRLREAGLRKITMTDLATGLGMSKKTLYENFSNKEDVLRCTMELWVKAYVECVEGAITLNDSPDELVNALALAQVDCLGRFSDEFWRELPQDYPKVHVLFRDALEHCQRRSRIALQRFLRDDVAPRVAIETYLALVARAMDANLCRQFGMSRRELTAAALDIWSKGALQAVE